MDFRSRTCSHVGAGRSGLRSPPPYFLSSAGSGRSVTCVAPEIASATALAKRKGPLARPGSVRVVLWPHGHLGASPMAPERIQQQRHGIIAATSPAHLVRTKIPLRWSD